MSSAEPSEKPLILYTDDDEVSVLMGKAALVAAGYRVVQAASGEEALTQVLEHSPDLIIMDAVMPGIDGFEAIKRIRRLPEGEHTPIMMVTGLDDHNSINTAYDEGATDFLTKPINFHILPYRINHMLRASAMADELRTNEAFLHNVQRISKIGSWEYSSADGQLSLSETSRTFLGLEAGTGSLGLSEAFVNLDENSRKHIYQSYSAAISKNQPFSTEFSIYSAANQAELTLRVEAEPQPAAPKKSQSQSHDSEDPASADPSMTIVGTLQDITEIANAQREIETLSSYDAVTGLPNRDSFVAALNTVLVRCERNSSKVAVLSLDLDHFKQINDFLGHELGNRLLGEIAQRLNRLLRQYNLGKGEGAASGLAQMPMPSHNLARLGGDEFVLLLSEIVDENDVTEFVQDLATVLGEPCNLGEAEVVVTTTCGISLFPNDAINAESLMKLADIAMFDAKEKGRNGFQFFSPQVQETSQLRASLENKLRQAIQNDTLSLAYLPTLDVSRRSLVGVEALLRWTDEQYGVIDPQALIRLADDTGLIVPLGRWVMRKACQQLRAWQDKGLAIESVSVNCSTLQFIRSDMLTMIKEVTTEAGIAPGMLEIELTEGLLLQDVDFGISALEKLKQFGVTVSIDDFGAGYTSLGYLKRLPVDKLKIDQNFIASLTANGEDEAVLSAIIKLCQSLGMVVLAEGVENKAQFKVLDALGCDQMQGFYIGKPVSASRLEQWLHRFQNDQQLKKAS